MIVREFLTRLAFNADDAKVRRFDKAVRVLRTGLLAVVGAATAASAAAIALAGDTARYGDELSKTARRLGINVDALEQLRFAAERSGVAQNTLEMALQRMTRRLSEAAAGGGEAKKAIAELGLDAQKLGAMAPEDAMNTLADALSGVENQSDRVRLAFNFFDSEGVALLNMIGEGSGEVMRLRQEFERLSGGLTGKQAKAAEAYSDALTNMQMAFEGLRLQIGAKLMPILQPLIESFTEFLVINRELILARVHRAFEILIGVMRSLMRMVARAWSVIDGIAQAMGGWENTIRLVAYAITPLVAIAFARWLLAVAAGIRAVAAAMALAGFLRFGLWAIALGGFALALDELINFIQNGEGYLKDLSEWMQGLGIDEGLADIISALTAALIGLASFGLILRLSGVGFAVRGVAGAVSALAGALTAMGAAGATAGYGILRKISKLGFLATIPLLGGGTRALDKDGNPIEDSRINPETGLPKGSFMDGILGGGDGEDAPADRSDRFQLPTQGLMDRLEDMRKNMSFEPAGPTMPPASEVNNTSNVVNMDARINVTAPPGSNREQAEFIATRIRAELGREINRAGTALET